MKRLKISGALNADKVHDESVVRDFIEEDVRKKCFRFIPQDYEGVVKVMHDYNVMTYGYDIVGSVTAMSEYKNGDVTIKELNINLNKK